MRTILLKFGKREIPYFIIFEERKSLNISVYPDKKVIVKAPGEASLKEIETKIKKRAAWIFKQLNYFEQFQPLTPSRKYINGETHLYLGRQYKLKVRKSIRPEVKLKDGYINIYLNNFTEVAQIKKTLDNWYKERAEIIIKEIYSSIEPEFHKKKLVPYSFIIRKMQKRWGSCTPGKKILINSELIKTPKHCIRYVLIHEICHLKYPNHSSKFYQLQSFFLPDWEYWKNKLELIMS